ncbi:hypothetical protein [Micromonospora inyonensis]|nr:hypothetical protein [Micromonospora inyonensis]
MVEFPGSVELYFCPWVSSLLVTPTHTVTRVMYLVAPLCLHL